MTINGIITDKNEKGDIIEHMKRIENNPLEWYKENRIEFERHHLIAFCYYSVDNNIENKEITDEVYKVIATASYEAYLKDDSKLGISFIADFLAKNYDNDILTLEDIQNASKWNILESVIDNNPRLITNSDAKENNCINQDKNIDL